MCGIAGYTGSADLDKIKRFTNTLTHRGPDMDGYFVDPESKVSLGHRRLSIIDLSPAGAQPMLTSNEQIVIVFNGEIYNYRELKEELRQFNIAWRGESDTEVILEYYQHFGDKVFEKLSGMFAIAIYNKSNNQLLLARDPLGKKPLHYTIQNGSIYFSSELKSFFEISELKKEIDPEQIATYFANDFVPTPFTIYKNIFKLEAGTLLKFNLSDAKVDKIKFWDFAANTNKQSSFRDNKFRVEEIIQKAVEKRMVSDVPLGVFLSGGIDSSIVAYFAQKATSAKINTFSISFGEKSYDESMYALAVSRHLGTSHHNFNFTKGDVEAEIRNIENVLDEPLADASILPTLILSKFARQKVTVALGGDGGDEVFAGYPTFQMERVLALFSSLPKKFLATTLRLVINILPDTGSNFSPKFLLNKILDGLEENNIFKRHLKWLGSFNHTELKQLLKLDTKNPYKFVDQYNLDNNNQNDLLRMYSRTYLQDEVMVKVDRASMHYSLETRSPLLDKDLVEFVFKLPYKWKLHFFTTKFLLKQICIGKLPRHIIFRKKKGFGVPLGKWFRGDLKYLLEDHLKPENFPDSIINFEYITQLKDEHLKLKRDHRKKLWSLAVFAIWYNKYKRNLTNNNI